MRGLVSPHPLEKCLILMAPPETMFQKSFYFPYFTDLPVLNLWVYVLPYFIQVQGAEELMKKESFNQKETLGNSLAVQWLGLHASTAGGKGLIPGRGTKISQATWHGQKKPLNEKKYREIMHQACY